MTAFLFVEQNEIRSDLKCQRQCLGLSKIEISPKECYHGLVAHVPTMNPRGVLHLLAARMVPPTFVELLPYTLSNVNLTEELPKLLKAADRSEVGKG
jgi:hypothetical protein